MEVGEEGKQVGVLRPVNRYGYIRAMGKREILSLHCHHQNDYGIKIGRRVE